MARHVVRTLAGFGMGLMVLSLFTLLVGWDEITAALSGASRWHLVVGSVIAFAGFLCVGVAWVIVVRRVVAYSPGRGFIVFLATQFANSITPLGQLGGEPFIAYLLAKDGDIDIGESLGAVVAADLLNTVPFFTVTILGIALFVLQFSRTPSLLLILAAVVGLLLLVIGTILGVLRYEDRIIGLAARAEALVARLGDRLGISRLIGASRDGLRWTNGARAFFSVSRDVLDDRRTIVLALTTAHASSLIGVVGLSVMLEAFDLAVPIAAVLVALPASQVAGYLPLPGGLGGIEIALAGLLTLLGGVPLAPASAAALMYRVATYWFGMMFLGGVAASQVPLALWAE